MFSIPVISIKGQRKNTGYWNGDIYLYLKYNISMSYVIWKPIYSVVENTEFPLGNIYLRVFIALPQKAVHVFSPAL